MIADKLDAFQADCLGPDFAKAFEFLKTLPVDAKLGRHDVSDRVYVNVMEYDADAVWAPDRLEGHRDYADIQVVLKGAEAVAWANNSELKIAQEYSKEQDVLFHFAGKASVSKIELVPGQFAVFFPQDGHFGRFAPASGPARKIRKAVAKVKL